MCFPHHTSLHMGALYYSDDAISGRHTPCHSRHKGSEISTAISHSLGMDRGDQTSDSTCHCIKSIDTFLEHTIHCSYISLSAILVLNVSCQSLNI